MSENERISRICGTLHPYNPVRLLAEKVESDPDGPFSKDIQELVRLIAEMPLRTSRERTLLSWLVCNANLTEDQRGAVSDALAQLVTSGPRQRMYGRASARFIARCALFVVMTVMLAFWGDIVYPSPSSAGEILVARIAFVVFGLVGYLVFRSSAWLISGPLSNRFDRETSAQYAPAVTLLGKIGRPNAIGAVANAYAHRPLRNSAALALAMVSARLRPEYYGTLPLDAVPALCSALDSADRDTSLVILQALGVIGDARAIYAVEREAAWAKSSNVKEAAIALLPTLRQRADECRSFATLVRPGSAPAPAGDTLLRAVRDAAVNSDAELLRASGD